MNILHKLIPFFMFVISGMKASSFVTTLRLLCLRPSMKSASSKLQAMENIDSKTFSAEMVS